MRFGPTEVREEAVNGGAHFTLRLVTGSHVDDLGIIYCCKPSTLLIIPTCSIVLS
jgi:hypothetical protein